MRNVFQQTSWILRFRARSGLRYLGANAFVLAVLGPLIIGSLFLVVDRGVLLARDTVRDVAFAGTSALPGPGFLILSLLLTALGLGYAFDEMYPRRDPRILLDVLPVRAPVRFVVAWLACLVANGLAWGGMVLAASLLGADGPTLPPVDVWAHLALALLPLAGIQLIAVLATVRLQLFRAGPVLAGGAVLAAMAVLGARWPTLSAIVLAPWLATASQIERAFGVVLGVDLSAISTRAWVGGWPLLAVTTLASAAVAYGLMARCQRGDRARAHALRPPGRGEFGDWLAHRLARLGPPIAAQVVRDVLLVLRRFSPIVYVAATLTILANLLVLFVVPTLGLGPFWHGRIALVGVVAGVLAQVALVPFVLRHELPRFWFERAAGVAAPQIWRAKLWLARLLALPPAGIGAVVLAAVPQSTSAYGIAILELVLAAWVVSSLIGVATFEIADRPLLGLIFSTLVALAWASLMIFYRQLLPFWLIGYAIVAGSIADRATHRVRFTEVIR